jgi:hypothetical protein
MKHKAPQRVVKEIVVRTECDHCHKVISGDDPDGWAYFRSYHNDWGYESAESWQDWDVCSYGCYLALVRKIFEDYGGDDVQNPTLSVDDKGWAFLRDMLATEKVS